MNKEEMQEKLRKVEVKIVEAEDFISDLQASLETKEKELETYQDEKTNLEYELEELENEENEEDE